MSCKFGYYRFNLRSPNPPSAAAEAKTILIGFTASQTGKLNVEGMRQINGLNLWVEQVNAAGGRQAGGRHRGKFGDQIL